MDYFDSFIDNLKNRKPSDEEKQIYTLLTSKDGKVLLDWLKNRTIEKQIVNPAQDGIQTALMNSRELGRTDIYHEIKRIMLKVSSYVNREQ